MSAFSYCWKVLFISIYLKGALLIQAEPKAQLLLVGSADGDDSSASLGNDFQNKVSTQGENAFPQRPSETHEASDILMTPRFLEDDKKLECSAQDAQNHSIASMQLKPTQQAIILAQCLSIEKRARSDELQSKLPDCVIKNPYFAICCLLLLYLIIEKVITFGLA